MDRAINPLGKYGKFTRPFLLYIIFIQMNAEMAVCYGGAMAYHACCTMVCTMDAFASSHKQIIYEKYNWATDFKTIRA